MEALSDWSEAAQPLDPKTIDWSAVASGAQEIRLRELPGAGNSMGRVKFIFPNEDGIYLHDTPDRDLLKKPDRHFSNGCIRLEDAATLGRWLLGKPITAAATAKTPEQAVPLHVGVPIYLTYLTATATDKGVAFRNDIYGRDQ
jgi:murein L,D-transpeptidase YcbB/YkuD